MRLDHEKKLVATGGEFNGVQALRGLAAGMVVIYHATQVWSNQAGENVNDLAWMNGAAGVDIFFVISGFVMLMSSAGKVGAHPARSFLERRWIRIVPLYWIMTSVALVQTLVLAHHIMGTGWNHLGESFSYVVASYLFVPWHNSAGETVPLLRVGWTLSYEMFFYFLFACALALRVSVVRFLTPVLLGLTFIGMFRGASSPTFTCLASPLLLEFLAGVLVAYAVLQGLRLQWWIAALLAGGGLVALAIAPDQHVVMMRALVWGVPAVGVVLGVVMLEGRFGRSIPRWALLLGDSSYSLYLSHLIVYWVPKHFLLKTRFLGPEVTNWHYEVVTVLSCVACGYAASLVLYWWVENPVNQALRRRWKLRQEMRAARAPALPVER